MRTLATALAICLAATSAEAYCPAGDLGCQVHGGSGAFGRDRTMLSDDRSRSSLYVNRTAPTATAPSRRAAPFDWSVPAPGTFPETGWRDLELPEGEVVDPWVETPVEPDGTPVPQGPSEAPYAEAPYAPAPVTGAPAGQRRAPSTGRQAISNAPQGPADSPQQRATSFFDTPTSPARR